MKQLRQALLSNVHVHSGHELRLRDAQGHQVLSLALPKHWDSSQGQDDSLMGLGSLRCKAGIRVSDQYSFHVVFCQWCVSLCFAPKQIHPTCEEHTYIRGSLEVSKDPFLHAHRTSRIRRHH